MAYNWEQGPSKHEFEGLFAARDGDPGDPADRGGTTATGVLASPVIRQVARSSSRRTATRLDGVANTPTETGERPP
jgi:hypothetical protein